VYVFLNNGFVKQENATLHISDLAIQRGYGVFDFFRLRDGVLLYVEDHLQRLMRSANIMHLQSPYNVDQMHQILRELVAKNAISNAGIRIILTGGYSPDAYEPTTPNFLIVQSPLQIDDNLEPKKVNIITHEFVRDLPEAKTINYSMGIWLMNKIKEQQAHDVLYHQNGVVSEFPRSNFFIVTQKNQIITPVANALLGITRQRVLELRSEGFEVKEGKITLQDIAQAKEAFLTSSTKRIQAVVQIDGKKIGDGQTGNITRELLAHLIMKEKQYATAITA
jgi:D-alanine transaminase/branched-chain amino acid aminotransferase